MTLDVKSIMGSASTIVQDLASNIFNSALCRTVEFPSCLLLIVFMGLAKETSRITYYLGTQINNHSQSRSRSSPKFDGLLQQIRNQGLKLGTRLLTFNLAPKNRLSFLKTESLSFAASS